MIEFDHPERKLRLSVLRDGLVHCRYTTAQFFDKVHSYGVDASFESSGQAYDCLERPYVWEIVTGLLKIIVRKDDLGIEFFVRKTGVLLSRDISGVGAELQEWNGEHKVWCKKSICSNEHFYGLGDKPCSLNMRGKRFELWGVDHYAFKSDADPLYKNIPFFLSLCDTRSYGIFFDNPTRSYVDFGAQDSQQLIFGAEGAELDYYFFYAATPIEIIEQYTQLTGLPAMPPLWALGYHQSKWSYYPESTVVDVAEHLRSLNIPCDAIYLDTHYMSDYQTFTWDAERFADPSKFVLEMEDRGFKVVTIANPGIKINPDLEVWRSGIEHNIYCRRQDGALLEAEVWPGLCHFPDFTSPKARLWWADQLEHQVAELGVRGIWVDMNEPAVFPDRTFPLDTRHDFDGHPCSHAKAHNIYGQCMAQASQEGMQRHGAKRRPFVLSRSGYAGLQRHAATWTGDNCSSWDHLKMANFQCQRLSCSGVSFCGSDVGGFLGHPTPELFCRWMQMSAFHTLFRNHASGEFGGQEPWLFGEEVLQYVRFAIEQRYRLLPYFYTQFWKYSKQGTPVIRSLALQCFENVDTYWRSSEFFLGEHLFIVPIHHPDEKGRFLYLPKGQWYSLWDNTPAPESEKDVWCPSPLSHIPVFARAGAIIPRWQVQQYVGEIPHPLTTLDLWWTPKGCCKSDLYEDEGDGYSYQEGEYLYHQFCYEGSEKGFKLIHSQEGIYQHPQQIFQFCLRAFPSQKIAVFVDGKAYSYYTVDSSLIMIELPKSFETLEVMQCV